MEISWQQERGLSCFYCCDPIMHEVVLTFLKIEFKRKENISDPVL